MKFENFCVNYGKVEIIKSLTIEVGFPSIVAIIGNNGSGKSTFFNALRSKVPFKGTAFFNGKEITKSRLSYLGVKSIFNFSFPVKDFIRINAESDLGDSCFEFLVKNLQLEKLIQTNIECISEGQMQKVLIAQTLIQDSDMILLDEPETHLDIRSRKVLSDALRAYLERYQRQLWIISHDLDLVEQVAEKVINFSQFPLKLDSVSKESILWHRDFLSNL